METPFLETAEFHKIRKSKKTNSYHHVGNGTGRWYVLIAKEWSPKSDFTKTNVADP
jgi:hypothetical protein